MSAIRPTLPLVMLLLAACVQPVPYKPDRQIVRSIPPDQARRTLRELLGRAHPYNPSVDQQTFDRARVDDAGFRVSWTGAKGILDAEPPRLHRSYEFADLEPRAYLSTDRMGVIVKLTPGEYNPVTGAGPETGCLWFSLTEDAETLIDAIESLKAAAR